MTLVKLSGVDVLVCDTGGPAVDGRGRATDLIGEALSARAKLVAVPTARLDPAFFQLRSGLAGEVAQLFVNYELRLAVVGDISAEIGASPALADWVRESNRGAQVWFVSDLDALAEKLAAGQM